MQTFLSDNINPEALNITFNHPLTLSWIWSRLLNKIYVPKVINEKTDVKTLQIALWDMDETSSSPRDRNM